MHIWIYGLVDPKFYWKNQFKIFLDSIIQNEKNKYEFSISLNYRIVWSKMICMNYENENPKKKQNYKSKKQRI